MIILVADDNALSREVVRELLEESGQVAEKFGVTSGIISPVLSGNCLIKIR